MAQCVRHEFLARVASRPLVRGTRRWGYLAACVAVLGMEAGPVQAATPTAHYHAHAAADKAATSLGHAHVHGAKAAKTAEKKAEKTAHAAARHHHAAAVAAGVGAGAVAGAGVAAASAAHPATATPPAAPPDASALAPVDNTKGSVTGLPLPRFAAFRADEVNLRTGPGQRYPIDWVYHRRGLPVKIEREFDVWRLVEDSDGQKGWVHQATLVGTRTFVIPGLPPQGDAQQAGQPTAKETDVIGRADTRIVGHVTDVADAADIKGAVMLHADANTSSAVVAVLRPGVVGTLRQCQAGTPWCKVSVKQYSGWIERSAMWGLLPQEVIAPS